MNPRRQRPPPAPAAVLLPPVRQTTPAPPVVLEHIDEEQEAVKKRALVLLSGGKDRRSAVLQVMKEFQLDYPTASASVTDVVNALRDHMDDEGSIDTVMWRAAARLHDMTERFYQIAMQPIPDQVLDVPGLDPQNPLEGAQYRPLTPAERAQEVGARAVAANVAVKAQTTLTSVVGRRSTRWAEKPAQVAVQVNVGGLSPEDQETLERLRLAAAGSSK